MAKEEPTPGEKQALELLEKGLDLSDYEVTFTIIDVNGKPKSIMKLKKKKKK